MTFPILGVFRLKGQSKRDSGIIVRSCKARKSSVSIARVYRPVVARVIEPPCGPVNGLLADTRSCSRWPPGRTGEGSNDVVRRQRWVYRIEPSRFPPDFPKRLDRFMEAAELSSRGAGPAATCGQPDAPALAKGDATGSGTPHRAVHPRSRYGPPSHPVAGGGRPGGCRAQNPLSLSGLGEAASAKPSGPLPVSPHWGVQGLRASGATHLQYRPSYVDLSAAARSRYSLPRRRPRPLGGSRRGSCPTVVPLHRGGDGWQPWFRLRQG